MVSATFVPFSFLTILAVTPLASSLTLTKKLVAIIQLRAKRLQFNVYYVLTRARRKATVSSIPVLLTRYSTVN